MAPFTHCSPDKPGRFHDGSFGAYYAADNFETAIAEVTHHQAQRLSDSRDEPGWISDMRELVGAVRADLLDIRAKGGFEALLAPDDYAPSQVFRSEEHTSELQSLMRISYAVFCLKKKTNKQNILIAMTSHNTEQIYYQST